METQMNSWTAPTFEPGWSDLGQVGIDLYLSCGYRQEGDVVHLKGSAINKVTWQSGAIFTLPEELRPQAVVVCVIYSDNGGANRLRILPDGRVIAPNYGAIHLNGVSFSIA